MRGPAGTGRSGLSMADGRQGQGAGREEGVRDRREPWRTSECVLKIFLSPAAEERRGKVQSLSTMSETTESHSKGTARVPA